MADQMAHLFPSTSQPLPSSAICAAPQPSSHSISTSDDGMDLRDLMLSPETLMTLARYHASGQLPTILNHLSQLTPAGELATTTKRTMARSHSHLGIPKANDPSTYARPAMIPKPVPQPLDAARYQPPPMKARARRVARVEKGKARAAPMPVIAESWDNNGAEHMPPFDPQRHTATQPAPSQAFAAAVTPTPSVGPSAVAAQPSRSWRDLAKIISDPAQQSTLSNAELARAICEQPGLGALPVGLVERVLPQLRGVAGGNKDDSDGPSGSSAHQENPRPLYIEAPSANMSPVVPPVSVPEMDQSSFSGFFFLTPSPESLPSMAPTTVAVDPPCETEHPPATLNPLWVFEEPVRNETTSIATATATQETNAEEQHREALPVEPLFVFDVDFQMGFESIGISPATYEEIERNLIPIIDHYQSTGVVCEANTNETGTSTEVLAGSDHDSEPQEQTWDQYFDFSGSV